MKKYVELDSLWNCETCFHHQDGKCSPYVWCEVGESYRPAYDKLVIIEGDIITENKNQGEISMRFKKNIPIEGIRKTVTKFLWFPVAINFIDHWDIRWLEKATIEYRYTRCWGDCWWIPYRFID